MFKYTATIVQTVNKTGEVEFFARSKSEARYKVRALTRSLTGAKEEEIRTYRNLKVIPFSEAERRFINESDSA